jgi:nitrogen fixation NifU-like protein
MLTGEMAVEESDLERLGKLKILSGVCKFPARVKCASLAWHTMNAALKGSDKVASTE